MFVIALPLQIVCEVEPELCVSVGGVFIVTLTLAVLWHTPPAISNPSREPDIIVPPFTIIASFRVASALTGPAEVLEPMPSVKGTAMVASVLATIADTPFWVIISYWRYALLVTVTL